MNLELIWPPLTQSFKLLLICGLIFFQAVVGQSFSRSALFVLIFAVCRHHSSIEVLICNC